MIMRSSFRFSESGRRRQQKIVVFDKDVDRADWMGILSSCRGHVLKELPFVHGLLVLVDEDEAADVESLASSRSGVLRVDDDIDIDMVFEVGRLAWGPKLVENTPWGISRINLKGVDRTGRGVKVGVLDTGIDSVHPDIGRNVKGGMDAIGGTASARDDNGHGTHVSGTIAALRNGVGVVGVAPDASVYSVKVLDSRGSGKLSNLVQGMEWCVGQQIKVVNLSLSASKDNQTFRDVVQSARKAGITMVCAAGNSGPSPNTVGYPAKYIETIAVAAINDDDAVANFSSRGREIAVSAPGVDVLSTWPGRRYRKSSGTSMAAPHVTGAVALMLEADPALTPSEIKSILQSTSVPVAGAGSDEQGAGVIDVAAALARVAKKRTAAATRVGVST